MCLIVDANRVHAIERGSVDAIPILKRLAKRSLRLVTSQALAEEWVKGGAGARMRKLWQQGAIFNVENTEVDELCRRMAKDVDVQSNDYHILALAVVSAATLLYTGDKPLMRDFRNARVMGKVPTRKVYSSKKNVDLLDRFRCVW